MAADIGLTCRVPAQPVKARLHDLSHYGCCVELASGWAETGASIVFELPNGDRMTGQVMWVSEDKAGVRFAHGLRPGTALALGLQDDQVSVAISSPDQTEPSDRAGIFHHWYRGLAKIFG